MRIGWPPHLARIEAPSQFTDIGKHTIRLAFGRYHAALARHEHPASLADTLFTDPVSYSGKPLASPIESMQGGETLIPAWAMPIGKDSWILRLHEVAGQRGTFALKAGADWKISPADAFGKPQGSPNYEAAIAFTPYQIVSLLFQK
jgi:alpha-mannosidase